MIKGIYFVIINTTNKSSNNIYKDDIMAIKEITCKSAINRISNSRLPYHLDLNVYRGCTHGCKYCYAIYSNRYLQSDNFFGDVFVKTNIVEVLEKELRRKRNKDVINLGSVTDSYQPIEEKYKIMPEILKLMIKYEQPVIISTKSDLILRDIELIDELSRLTYVNIASTITVMDEDRRRIIEPGSVSSKRRVNMLREMKKTKASRAIHTMPIMPYITDDRDNLEEIFAYGKDIDINYILTGPLNLKGDTKKVFMDFVKDYFPDQYENVKNVYGKGAYVSKEYKEEMYKRINDVRRKYEVRGNYMKGIRDFKKSIEVEQLSLF